MNKLLVVVPYKLWFLQQQHYKRFTRFTRLANSCSRNILGIVVIKFNHIGCSVSEVLINDGWI